MNEYISGIEAYENWQELGLKPRIVVYGRTSKVNGNETNLNNQKNYLLKMINELESSGFNSHKNDYYYDENLIVEEDLNCSGKKINRGLKKFLDNLLFEDTVVIFNVSRITRMDIRSDGFKYLITKLYQDNRSVVQWNKKTKKIVHISKSEFKRYAKLSNEQYETIKANSKMGNEKKSEIKRKNMHLCLEYLGSGLDRKLISKELCLSIQTIDKYIRILKDLGLIEDKRIVSKLTRSYSPEDNII